MDYKIDRVYLKKLDQTMEEILTLLPVLIPLNTFFIATNDQKINYVIKVHNRDQAKTLMIEGTEANYQEALCRLVVEHGTEEPLVIDNLRDDALTQDHPATEQLNGGCYIGVPLHIDDHQVFGTLCALDNRPYTFTPEDITLIKTFGNLLSQVVTLEERTIRDPLTGLYNRSFVQAFFTNIVQNESRIAILFIELNRFKRINEVFGHLKGDQVIQLMAGRLEAGAEADDLVARFTGDRFIVMVRESKNRLLRKEVPRLGNRLLKSIRVPFKLDQQEMQISANIGVTYYPDDGDSIDNLLKNAESSLDLAKEQGGNSISYYQPSLIRSLFSEIIIENELRQSLDHGHFKLFFQPQIDLVTRKLVGFETLVRWHHPDRGILLPNDFISVAEESGIIFPLGEWVLNKVCEVKQDWGERGYPPFELGVNLSPRQFQDPNLFNKFKQVIESFNVNPAELNLEITETLIMKDLQLSQYLLNKFKDLGVRISIDDFGKGYSSLAYLRALPIDTIKIDRAFVTDLEESDDAQTIIQAIIGMAEALQLKIIAEGIETEYHDHFLKNYGCHIGQGYYYSKPIAEDEILDYLKN